MKAIIRILAATVALSAGSVRAGPPEEDAALTLLKAGQYEQAAAAFGKIASEYAAKYHRTDKQWYFCATDAQQAIVYSVLGADKKVAITVLGPDWCDDLFLQAYAFTELKQPAKAEAALREALDLSPMNSHYASELGYVIAHTGRLEEGMQLYRKAEDYAAMATAPEDKKLKAAALRGEGWILAEKKD